MSTTVLVVDIHAEMYRDALQAEFPSLQFKLFKSGAAATGDLSDVDVMIMFGIEIRDEMLAGAPKLKWIQSLATGVDHFLRCPSLKPGVQITSGLQMLCDQRGVRVSRGRITLFDRGGQQPVQFRAVGLEL